MKIQPLFFRNSLHIQPGQAIHDLLAEEDLALVTQDVQSQRDRLHEFSVEDLILFFNGVSMDWSRRDHLVQKSYRNLGINFLLHWFRRNHLQELLQQSFRGNPLYLDSFQNVNSSGSYQLRAQPRGLAVHWLAGNVPVLGMLSWSMSLLTKNVSILKVSARNPWALPFLLDQIRPITVTGAKGATIRGEDIARTVAVVYYNKSNIEASQYLSAQADVRVAWGGREAIEAIMGLRRSLGSEDVVFGPKTSFAVVGKEYLSNLALSTSVASKIGHDASVFDQQGCNSPHTIFVETGGSITPQHFAELLAGEMERQELRIPSERTSESDALVILNKRAEYDLRGSAWYPEGTSWSVLYADTDRGLADPCYSRTLFVRPVRDVLEVADYCGKLTQTVGCALSPERKLLFAEKVSYAGIDRCPDVGLMSLYDSPWDGIFPMDRMVRWVKA